MGRCRDGRTADACWPAFDSYGDGRTVLPWPRRRQPTTICSLALDHRLACRSRPEAALVVAAEVSRRVRSRDPDRLCSCGGRHGPQRHPRTD
jgi:hypothetical protein